MGNISRNAKLSSKHIRKGSEISLPLRMQTNFAEIGFSYLSLKHFVH